MLQWLSSEMNFMLVVDWIYDGMGYISLSCLNSIFILNIFMTKSLEVKVSYFYAVGYTS